MKTFFAILLLSLSLSGFSQTVETTINGVRYSCFPVNPNPGGGYDPVACGDVAYRGPFSREEATRLCAGARSDAPANCAIKAYAGPFSKEESINLCIRAYSVGPSECAVKAYAGPFSKEESLHLCGSPRASVATADCAIRAFSGPYSREESIRICKESYGIHAKLNISGVSKADFETLLIQANEKAVLEGSYKK
jgi:hypothetical protein